MRLGSKLVLFIANEQRACSEIFGHWVFTTIVLNCTVTRIDCKQPCESVIEIGTLNVPFEYGESVILS